MISRSPYLLEPILKPFSKGKKNKWNIGQFDSTASWMLLFFWESTKMFSVIMDLLKWLLVPHWTYCGYASAKIPDLAYEGNPLKLKYSIYSEILLS